MDVQLTVKGWLELARMHYLAAESVKKIAIMAGGEWFTEWDNERSAGRRCCDRAVEMLGDFNMMPKDLLDLYLPF